MSTPESIEEKVFVAKFALGHSLHFDFERLLIESNIIYKTKINVEYFEADNLEVISFFVNSKDVTIAKDLEKKAFAESPPYPHYPKFMKIFWLGLFFVTILWIVLAILMK